MRHFARRAGWVLWRVALRSKCHARPGRNMPAFKELNALGFKGQADCLNRFVAPGNWPARCVDPLHGRITDSRACGQIGGRPSQKGTPSAYLLTIHCRHFHR